MNWIKVESNPADNDRHPGRLPPLEKVVHIIYKDQDSDDQAIALGGRVEGEDGWLWAVHDIPNHWRSSEGYLLADDEYLVTHWAEIEWPE